jgi:predicted acyltransferase
MTDRLRSLDVFRGATVALMILVNNPGHWGHLYSPLAHAAWHGMTPTDLVFPWFLFAVGNALALVMARDAHRAGVGSDAHFGGGAGASAGASASATPAAAPGAVWWRIARRTALIFAIGLFLNASPFVRWDTSGGGQGELVWRSWENLRFMGVLQRIALAYGAAALIMQALPVARRRQGALVVSALLLLGYWAACVSWGAPGDPYSLQGFFGTALDRQLLGASHLYKGEGVPFDPEGLVSTVPAVAQVLLGWWVGDGLARVWARRGLGWEDLTRLFLAACALLVLAYLWQLVMPLNKKIWTSSYVLATTGLAMAALAVLLSRIDTPGRTAGTAGTGLGPRAASAFVLRLFEAFGQNALFVFVLSGFLPRVLALLRWPSGVKADGSPAFTSPLPWWHEHVVLPLAGVVSGDPRWASLLFALINLAFYGALAWWLMCRRIFIRV